MMREAYEARRLSRGTLVVSKHDAEPGMIVRVSTYRRNGIEAWSYQVETIDGLEIWEVGELFIPRDVSESQTKERYI